MIASDHYNDDDAMLCGNCLALGAAKVPVGYDKGSQRDPYRDQVPLCQPCRTALFAGEFAALAGRYTAGRYVSQRPAPHAAAPSPGGAP